MVEQATRDAEAEALPAAPAGSNLAVPPDALVGVARTRTFFPELETLRGVAVLLVFLFHVNGMVVFGRYPEHTLLNSVVRTGHTGVDLFFLLSAFLLSLPFIADGLGGRHVSVPTFFARRALRILPLYYTVVVVGAVLHARAPSDLLDGVPYLFFLNAFAGTTEPMTPYSVGWWSLATEMEFYLMLPLLPLALATRRGRIAGLLALAVYALAYVAMLNGTLHMSTVKGQLTFMFSAFARGPLFLWGIAAAWLYHVHGERLRAWLARSVWMRRGGADLLLALALLGLMVFLRWVAGIGPQRQMTNPDQYWHIINGAFWAVILLLLLLAPLRTKPLVCNALFARLGVLSFSIYLLHVPFMELSIKATRSVFPGLFQWNARTLLMVAVLGAALYAIATQTYRWIERPFLVRKSRFE